jgi:hypothetical protein
MYWKIGCYGLSYTIIPFMLSNQTRHFLSLAVTRPYRTPPAKGQKTVR